MNVYCKYCCKSHAVDPGEKECAPGAWIADEPIVDERGVWTHDFKEEARLMAGDNARLCGAVSAADKLAAAVKGVLVFGPRSKWQRERLERALQDYEIARQGN